MKPFPFEFQNYSNVTCKRSKTPLSVLLTAVTRLCIPISRVWSKPNALTTLDIVLVKATRMSMSRFPERWTLAMVFLLHVSINSAARMTVEALS